MNNLSIISPPGMTRLNQFTQLGNLGSAEPQQTFKDLLVQSIDQVNNMQQDADVAVETLMTGGEINPAEVLTAVQKADMAFKMMQQIRNKLVEAYQEIKEIQI
mgnify:FL=1